MRTRTNTQTQISTWIPNEQIAALDAHLAREAARVPGARMTRASWFAAIVARELATATPEGAAQTPVQP